jgi:dTDP-glucose pyrophosphorylase
LEDQIKQAQDKDEEIQQFKEKSSKRELLGFRVENKGSYGMKIRYAYQRMKHYEG